MSEQVLFHMAGAIAPVAVDIIILSLAKNEQLRAVTEVCLESLLASEDPARIGFRVLVLESNPEALPYAGRGVETLFPKEPFGYHKYMNLGIAETRNPYVCLCNNDLYFTPGWASELLRSFTAEPDLYSASPICSLYHPSVGISENTGVHYGYGIRQEVSGWCLFFRREMLDITGPLDERFLFWFADNDYAKTLEKHGLKHALVTRSVVNHLESKTLKTHGQARQRLLTKKAKYYFDRKWNGLGRLQYGKKLAQFYIKLSLRYLQDWLGRK